MILIDERLSTVTAASHLREGGIDSRKQRGVIDQAAAVVIRNSSWTAGGPPRDRPRRPRRGHHSSPDGEALPPYGRPDRPRSRPPDSGYGVPRYEPGRDDPPSWTADLPPRPGPTARPADPPASRDCSTARRSETGPLVEPEWWSYGSSDDPHYPLPLCTRRHMRTAPAATTPGRASTTDRASSTRPRRSRPGPRACGTGCAPARTIADEAETVAHPTVGGAPARQRPRARPDSRGAHRADDDVDTDATRRRAPRTRTPGRTRPVASRSSVRTSRRTRRAPAAAVRAASRGAPPRRSAPAGPTPRTPAGPCTTGDDALVHDERSARTSRSSPTTRGPGARRRKRSPVAVLVSLLVLAGLVVGIVVGGQKLLTLINPASRDYTGQGTGQVQIRVQDGDTLSDIARTLVKADVIASVGPFVNAAEADADAVGIQPGVYGMRLQMSGQAALDLMLDPTARLLSRVTVPEGLTVAADAGPAGRGDRQAGRGADRPRPPTPRRWACPPTPTGRSRASSSRRPTTSSPDTAPADILKQMVARGGAGHGRAADPRDQRLTVLTKASIVQAEAGSVEDMGKVARVLDNRLADGMPLQLDTTVNYANGKSGITTTPQDRQNPSPYNTYLHPGLTPGPISNPGEEALRAVLHPTPGDWRYFVVVNPDTGETRFAVTGAEHQQNVALFQQWLRAHPDG